MLLWETVIIGSFSIKFVDNCCSTDNGKFGIVSKSSIKGRGSSATMTIESVSGVDRLISGSGV